MNYMSAISMIMVICVNTMIGNNEDNINMHLSDDTLSGYITGNRSTLQIELSRNDTHNAHTGARFEQIAYTFTNDYGEINVYHTCVYDFDYNDKMDYASVYTHIGHMNNVTARTFGASVSEIVLFLIIQSWKVVTSDNSMCNIGMGKCYLFQMRGCYMHGIQPTTVCVMKLWTLIVDLCPVSRITKANRRGVTCTGLCTDLFGILLYPYLLGSHLFVRELE